MQNKLANLKFNHKTVLIITVNILNCFIDKSPPGPSNRNEAPQLRQLLRHKRSYERSNDGIQLDADVGCNIYNMYQCD